MKHWPHLNSPEMSDTVFIKVHVTSDNRVPYEKQKKNYRTDKPPITLLCVVV